MKLRADESGVRENTPGILIFGPMAAARIRFGIAAGVVVVSILGLIAWSLSDAIAYYRTPAELAAGGTQLNERVRVAGYVVEGSVVKAGPTTIFSVTDGKAELAVTTEDLLPDTFGAGVEVVAEGAMTSRGVFAASTVLAKCPSKFKAKLEEQ
jgi:cytochrome c-type biogenesis protein CcmE